RHVFHARWEASAPQAPLLSIVAAHVQSGEEDNPIDVDSDSEEHIRDETKEELVGEDTRDEGLGGEIDKAPHMEEEESTLR
ncbi:hypothetical protein KI387_032411, partial [Taxus chinensis]